jgi:Cof subfamily protein (haloacid dehalogenase superfamily)
MKSYEGILLCSDFDDTIAVGGKVSKENIEAVNYFKSRGGKFTIISGRNYESFGLLRSQMEFNAPFGGLNGSLITDLQSGEVLRRIPVRKYHVSKALDVYKVHPEMKMDSIFVENGALQLSREEGKLRARFYNYMPTGHDLADEVWLDSVEELESRIEYDADGNEILITGNSAIDDYLRQDIYKSVIHTPRDMTSPENVTALRSYLLSLYGDEADVFRSWPYGVEIQNINATKGTAIEFLKEYTCAEKSVAIGNYENDISMIKAADVGVAVGNCFDECIKAADIVTVPCEEHSVADLIYNYL